MRKVLARLCTKSAILIGSWAWVPKFLPQITAFDKWVQRRTQGKWSLLRLAGFPGVLLTVTGRKSGLPRSTPLMCTPSSDGILVAGSNFGGPDVPAWVGNLRTAGEASIRYKGKEIAVTARELHGDERATAWGEMLKTWPNYRLYEERTARTIPVFLLVRSA